MRRFAGVVVVVVVFVLAGVSGARAQGLRRYELGASYAYMRVDSSAGALSLNGISFSGVGNVNRWLAVAGDVGGYHLEGFRLGTYLFGPRIMARAGRVSFFAQGLFGGAHANAGGRGFPLYHEGLAWAAGGGISWRVSERVSLRLAEAELVQTRLGGQVQNNFRGGVGLVFHFGAGVKRTAR